MGRTRPTSPRTDPPFVRRIPQSRLRQIEDNKNLQNEPIEAPAKELKVSIITSIYNGSINYLKEAHDSIVNQSYTNIEWCICSDGTSDKDIAKYLLRLNTTDNIKVKFLDKNSGISTAGNAAVSIATGEILAFFDYDDILHPDSIKEVVHVFKNYDMDIVYTDEETKRMDGKPGAQHIKPNFSPHYLLSCNYICHLLSVKRSLFDSVGGYREGFEGVQDHDLIFRLIQRSKKIFHIPKVLYYWRLHQNSYSVNTRNSELISKNGIKLIHSELNNRGLLVDKVESYDKVSHYKYDLYLNENDVVDIIIVSIDEDKTITCIDSILKNTQDTLYKIILLCFTEEEYNKYEDLYRDYSCINVFYENQEVFNLPVLINSGIDKSSGKFIVLLHDDIVLTQYNWIQTLIGYLNDSSVGVVGAKIIDNKDKILEFGNALGIKESIISPAFKGLHKNEPNNFRRAVLPQNTSAISSVAMAFSRDVYGKLKAFDAKYNLYYFDFDFCLRAKEIGLFNVITPDCEIIHNCNEDIKKIPIEQHAKSLYNDTNIFKSRYKHIIQNGDPYYNAAALNFAGEPLQITEKLDSIAPPKNKNIYGLVSFIVPWFEQIPTVIQSLLVQTYKELEIIVVYDGEPKTKEETTYIKYMNSFQDSRLKFYNTFKHFNDWGHTPRNYGLDKISYNSKAVVFTGVDNYYLPTFTEELFEPLFDNTSFTASYCNMLHEKKLWNEVDTKLEFSKIDCGCLMVRSDIAKEFRFGTKVSWEDWVFIEKLIKKYGAETILKIPRMLYIHN